LFWGFGLHEAIDQVGATVGPLMLTVVIAQNADYRRGFAALPVPALAALGTLALAWRLYPRPQDLEIPDLRLSTSAGFPKAYWVYLCGSALVAAGSLTTHCSRITSAAQGPSASRGFRRCTRWPWVSMRSRR
jgi:hypothetical protein